MPATRARPRRRRSGWARASSAYRCSPCYKSTPVRNSARPAKHLPGRSQGAIANACDRLVKDNLAQLAGDKPRRYTATTTATG